MAVIIDLSISLDGYIAGPNDTKEHALGTHGGEHIFDWYTGGKHPINGDPRLDPEPGVNREICEAMVLMYGTQITGRRTYDLTDGWNGTHPAAKHVVVVTHHKPDKVPHGDSTFAFVADVKQAVHLARELAGKKHVAIQGASVAQQALALGLVDEIFLHVAPIMVGGGVKLFDKLGDKPIKLELRSVTHGPNAVHQRYAVL